MDSTSGSLLEISSSQIDDIDDPHFTALKRSSTQEAATDCTDLTSDYSETHTMDSLTATTLPHFPEYRERPQKYSKDPINN